MPPRRPRETSASAHPFSALALSGVLYHSLRSQNPGTMQQQEEEGATTISSAAGNSSRGGKRLITLREHAFNRVIETARGLHRFRRLPQLPQEEWTPEVHGAILRSGGPAVASFAAAARTWALVCRRKLDSSGRAHTSTTTAVLPVIRLLADSWPRMVPHPPTAEDIVFAQPHN